MKDHYTNLSGFWIKKIIVDVIEKDTTDVLPPPTKINVTSFQDITDQALQHFSDLTRNKFNILEIIVNCFPPRYVASVDKRLLELIGIDAFKQTFTFTIWKEAIIENEGS